jgi:hypothetical protein
MMRTLFLSLLLLGCGNEDTEPSQESFFECVALPRSECPQPPLPQTDDRGRPWPTYSEVALEVADCSQSEAGCTQRRRGTCSDGKTFTELGNGFTGEFLYFSGETLVGVWRWGDVISDCRCPGSGFGDPVCQETYYEQFICVC